MSSFTMFNLNEQIKLKTLELEKLKALELKKLNTLGLINKLKRNAKIDKSRFMKSPENKEIFRDDEKKPDDFKDKTFLYIRATTTDIGNRPIPSGTNYWNSPDIEIYDSNNTLISTNQINRNQNYTINVLVYNDGDMSCNSCVVDLFICNPTIGFDRLNATQIGIQSVSILGHSSTVVSFKFTPTNENEGHQCLFARAYSYVNGDLPNSGDQFFTATDRHVGQQNLCIINQGTELEFLISPAFRVEKANLKLKVTQNKEFIRNINLEALSDLKMTNRTISADKLLFLESIVPVVRTNRTTYSTKKNNTGFIKSNRSVVNMTGESISEKTFDITKFSLIKPITENAWTYNYNGSVSRVTLAVPNLSLQKNRATTFEIEMINIESNESVGGLTVIVKG